MKYILLTFTILISCLSYSKNFGVQITPPHLEKYFKAYLGYRLQAIASQDNEDSDISLRRLRANLKIEFKDKSYFYADIRNDRISSSVSDNNNFELGDAYYLYQINKNHYFKFFRAKVDVSRSQTASSKNLIYVNRTAVSDYSSDFIISSRRAPNAQINGSFKWMTYQLSVSDSLSSESLVDSKGQDGADISKKRLALGAKLRFYPIKSWANKKIQESYYNGENHLSLGVGFFHTPSLEFNVNGLNRKINRSLLNLELTLRYSNFSIQAEHFTFQGVINDFTQNSSVFDVGSSKGFQVLSDYLIPKTKVAPFIRYEKWDQFEQQNGPDLESYLYGINYYYNKGVSRFGVAYQKDIEGSLAKSISESISLYAMFDY